MYLGFNISFNKCKCNSFNNGNKRICDAGEKTTNIGSISKNGCDSYDCCLQFPVCSLNSVSVTSDCTMSYLIV